MRSQDAHANSHTVGKLSPLHVEQVAQIKARMQPESVEAVRQPESALVTHAEALEAEGSWSKAIDAYLSVTQQHIHDQDSQIEVCQFLA